MISNRRKFDDFDHFSSEYRQIHDQNLKISGENSDYFCEHKVKEIKRREHSLSGKKILDLGCGDGRTEVFFVKHFPRSKIFGIDVSKKSINQAINKKIPNCRFVAYNGSIIPYPNNVFDIVFMACVLHHISWKYHQKIIEECYRVLKSGGKLYIFEHNIYNPLTRMLVKNCVFDGDAILLPARYLIKVVRLGGFVNLSRHYVLFFPRIKLFKPFIAHEHWLSKLPIGGQYYIKAQKL